MKNEEHPIAEAIETGLTRIAHALCPPAVGTDETGGAVGSLTEAVMGVTAGLMAVAAAINSLAEATKRYE